ncbi:MAG: hypothetical protein Q9222_000651 [Ikaeria aurantiellina]
MAKTRGDSGITTPRVAFVPNAAPQSRQTTTKKKSSAPVKKLKTAASKVATGATTKANTSKPRARKSTTGAASNKTATGRVSKAKPKAAPISTAGAAPKTKKAPKTSNKRDPSLLDKVTGVAEKIVGTIEGKPGKKAAGTKKIRGTDGKGATRAKKE